MKSKFVFICAAGHSGSTLLDLLLGSHPEGISVGEITQLPKNIALNSVCSCGRHLSECDFWSHLITDFGNSIDQDLWKSPYSLNLGFIKAGDEIDPQHQTRLRMALRKLTYGAEYARLRWRLPTLPFFHREIKEGAAGKTGLFKFILERTKQQFIVDSSKHYLGALSLFEAAPEETRVIHLVRDGRAVFNSGIGRGLRPSAALSAWARHCRRSARILKGYLPESALLTVHYEDLASRPDDELRRISKFLGIDFRANMLDFAAADSHIANGNRMRFVKSSEIRLDERWRKELTMPMLHYFDRHAGDLNRQLGYAD